LRRNAGTLRAFAAAVLQNWRFTAQRDRHRRLFGTFLWEIAQRTSCTRVYTRMMRTWHAALMQGWKFRMCARAHAGLHRRRVWHHCFQHWRHAAGAPVLSNKTWAQSGPSAAACDVILDPSKKPIVLKWQRMCIGERALNDTAAGRACQAVCRRSRVNAHAFRLLCAVMQEFDGCARLHPSFMHACSCCSFRACHHAGDRRVRVSSWK